MKEFTVIFTFLSYSTGKVRDSPGTALGQPWDIDRGRDRDVPGLSRANYCNLLKNLSIQFIPSLNWILPVYIFLNDLSLFFHIDKIVDNEILHILTLNIVYISLYLLKIITKSTLKPLF